METMQLDGTPKSRDLLREALSDFALVRIGDVAAPYPTPHRWRRTKTVAESYIR
jgi:hypothetical protein